MSGFLFGVFILITIGYLILLCILPQNNIEDLIVCSVISVLIIIFFFSAIMIDVERKSPRYDNPPQQTSGQIFSCMIWNKVPLCSALHLDGDEDEKAK